MSIVILLLVLLLIVAAGWWLYAEGYFSFLLGDKEPKRVSKGAQKRAEKK